MKHFKYYINDLLYFRKSWLHNLYIRAGLLVIAYGLVVYFRQNYVVSGLFVLVMFAIMIASLFYIIRKKGIVKRQQGIRYKIDIVSPHFDARWDVAKVKELLAGKKIRKEALEEIIELRKFEIKMPAYRSGLYNVMLTIFAALLPGLLPFTSLFVSVEHPYLLALLITFMMLIIGAWVNNILRLFYDMRVKKQQRLMRALVQCHIEMEEGAVVSV